MARFKKIIISSAILAFNFVLAPFVLAEDCGSSGGLKNPLSVCTFAAFISKITKIVAQIGLPIAALAIIYAGFLFISARGSEDKITKAKTTFFWAIIGTALLLGAWAIATAIVSFFPTSQS